MTSIVAQTFFSVLATMSVMAFSRWREYRADLGGAQLAERDNMIGALQSLQWLRYPPPLPGELVAFGIHSGMTQALSRLFTGHPPLEERITALQRFFNPQTEIVNHGH